MKNRVAAIAALACLASCVGGTYRVKDVDTTKIRAGMSVEQVRALIGRPWHLVSNPLDPDRQVHRYVMSRKMVNPGEVDDEGERTGRVTQYRVMELVYVDGKLVGPGGEGR